MQCAHGCGAAVWWDASRRRLLDVDGDGMHHRCDFILGVPLSALDLNIREGDIAPIMGTGGADYRKERRRPRPTPTPNGKPSIRRPEG